jgi:rubrerythrin
MADREKVIKGLKCCSEIKEKCDDCPYSGVLRCMMVLKRDALELLKAQDETRLIYHYSRPNVYADLWLHCEKCGEKVDNKWRPKYCPGCGRAVKWND